MNELEIKLLDVMGIIPELSTTAEINQGLVIINQVQTMTVFAKSTLIACYKAGPLDAGDLPSKTGKAELIDLGFVIPIIVKGEDGFYAATYPGAMAVKLLQSKLM